MDANELILAAFGRLGFGDLDGAVYGSLVREIPGGFAYVGGLDADDNVDGPPVFGRRVLIETDDTDGNPTGSAEFPDPVTAYTFVRFVSGWVA